VIVELFGCSGSGKTTLAARLATRLRQDGVTTHREPARRSSVAITARNLAIAPAMVLVVVASGAMARAHLAMTWRHIRRRRLSNLWTVARCAAAARISGEHLLRMRRSKHLREIVVVDEGILTTVQLAFTGDTQVSESEVRALAELMPLPDIVVWVRSPISAIVDRTSTRLDAPREMRTLTKTELWTRTQTAQGAYGIVAEVPGVGDRMIQIWNPSEEPESDEELNRTVDRVALEIQQRMSA